MKVWGHIEVPTAVVSTGVALVASALTGIVTFTVAEARAAAQFRATMADHTEQIDRLRSLPVDDLKRMPARFEIFVAAAEAQAKDVAEIKRLLQPKRRSPASLP